MAVNRDPSPRKRAPRSATTKETEDQVGLENKPPPFPKSNTIPAGDAEGGGKVLQPLDVATKLEKQGGAKDEAEESMEEGEIRPPRTVIPSATGRMKMLKAQRSPTTPEQTPRAPPPVAADFMPDSPPISSTPARASATVCSSMARLTDDGLSTSQAQTNVMSPSPAGVYPVILPPKRTPRAPPKDINEQMKAKIRTSASYDGGLRIKGCATNGVVQAALPITVDQGSFLAPRKVAMDERLPKAKEKAKAAVKSVRSKKQGSGKAAASEKSSDLRDVGEVAAGPLLRQEDEDGDGGDGTKQEHSPEGRDAAPLEEDSNGSRDIRGEGNADRPSTYQDDAGNSKDKGRNSKRRRYSSSSDTDAEIRLFTKRTRRNSNLAITAILESVHLSNTGLRLYENERDERTIRKAQSYLQTEGFLTDIGLANITRLFRDVKLAREYLQLWVGRPFSVVSMKEWFLVELRDWKKRGGSISGQGGRGDYFGDNFFPTPRFVLVEAPLIAASGGDVVPAESRSMANNPHWEPRHSTARGMDRLRVEGKCFNCSRHGHEAKSCPVNIATASNASKELFPVKKGRRG